MTKINSIHFKAFMLLGVISMMASSCERDLSDEAVPATYPTTAEIFIDGFSGGLDYFPFGDSRQDAFTVDNQTFYSGTASMRIDVPSIGDRYAGATFSDNGGRNLTGYDALTFWAKANRGAVINEIGFGVSPTDRFKVTKSNLRVGTNWRKFVIPIPNPSKLIRETGMLWYAEDALENGGNGYTFWIDELKFEKLGTVAQPRPAINGGDDETITSFIGSNSILPGLTQTFNLGDGSNQTLGIAPAYFDFKLSNDTVATISELGEISVIGDGTVKITAILAGVKAAGSLTIESVGDFDPAPTPTREANNVTSIFSDSYTNPAIEYYNGFFNQDGQTTLGGNDININGNQIIQYTELNFVALKTLNTVDASDKTHYHVDINVNKPVIEAGDFIRVILLSNTGGVETQGFYNIPSSDLVANGWSSLDIPLSSFTGAFDKSTLSLFFFVTDGTNPALPGSVTEILVDNMYLYK